jgi:hypothetical protein
VVGLVAISLVQELPLRAVQKQKNLNPVRGRVGTLRQLSNGAHLGRSLGRPFEIPRLPLMGGTRDAEACALLSFPQDIK